MTSRTSTTTTKDAAAGVASRLSGVQYLFAAMVVLGFVLVAGFAGYGQYQQTQVWDDTPVCADGATDDCLVAVEGRVDSRLVSGEKTYYFYLDDGAGDAAGVDVTDRVKLGDQRKWSGTFERALFDGDDLIAVERYDGDREYKGGLFTTFGWYLYGVGAGLVLVVAGIGLLARSLFRK